MSTETTLITNYPEFIRFLEHESVMHQSVEAEKSAYIPTQLKGLEGVQLIRWQEADSVLQFIQSMPIEVPEDRIAAVESATARLNHALAIPGIDLNHEGKNLAYRLILPLKPRGGVQPDEISAYFRLAVQIATELVPTLQRVVSGQLASADVVADAQKERSGAASPPETAAPAAPDPSVFQVD
jgi:hypothetical protein